MSTWCRTRRPHSPYGHSGLAESAAAAFSSGGYSSPGWQRAQSYWQANSTAAARPKRQVPPVIDAEPVEVVHFSTGDRVFHDKFGYGRVTEIDGRNLHIEFEKAGLKRVVASFVTHAERAS